MASTPAPQMNLRTPRAARDRSGHVSSGSEDGSLTAGPTQSKNLPPNGAPPAQHSPVSSNAPAPTTTLARMRRRASHDTNAVTQHAQTRMLKQLDAQGRLRTFVDHGSQFRDDLMKAMPGLSARLVKFLEAEPTYVYNNQGTPKLVMPDDAALTDQQISILTKVLDKFLPKQKPMDLDGQQKSTTRKVSIHVHTVGDTPDYKNIPGGADGIANAGAAKPITTITFGAPGAEPVVTEETDDGA